MTRNEGGLDRIIRVVIAIAAVVGAVAVGLGSVGAWVLLAVAAIMLVTAVTGFCPLYRVFGLSTCRVRA
jgi:fatty acid desaturase